MKGFNFLAALVSLVGFIWAIVNKDMNFMFVFWVLLGLCLNNLKEK